MVFVKVIAVVVVLYLLIGALLGLRHAKETEALIQEFIKDGATPSFIRGYRLGAFKVALLYSPVFYLKGFLGLYK